MKKFLLNRALAAKEKITFFVLLFAALVLKGTCAYAQEDLSDRYAWRLDSVMYSYPLMDGEDEEYGRRGRREVVRYTYGLDGLPIDSGFSTLDYEEFYTTRKPLRYRINIGMRKHEYRSFGKSGKHTVLHYAYTDENFVDTTGGEINNSLFALYQKDEYAFDSTRVIYDADGGIVRTIHHYNKTTTHYNYTTGACTGIERVQVLATDSTEDEKQWSCNVTTGVWSLSKDLHRDYSNHHLTYSESTRRKFYGDGMLKEIWVDGTGYNELGVKTRTYSSYKIYQENGEPKPFQPGGYAWRENIEKFEGGRIVHSSDTRTSWSDDGMHTWRGNPTKDYEYLPNGMVIRTENGTDKYIVDLQGKDHLIYHQNPYSPEPYYSRYIYYDDFTLKQQVDSILTNDRRAWTITDFDERGKQIHKIERVRDTTQTDWTYIREETYAEDYTETVTLQNRTRTTSRIYNNYDFDNRYSLFEEQDEDGNWKSKNSSCYWFNVSFGMNGEPLTAIQYSRSNEQWVPSAIYTFTYIPEWNLYRRDLYGYSGGYIDFFTKKGESKGWYLRYAKGYVHLSEYDEFGRKTKDSECSFDSAMHVKDTTSYTVYRYFPLSSCTKVAESTKYRRNAETGAWEISGTPSRTDSYTHEVRDEKGNLAIAYTFSWEGDSIITDTADYKLVYDAQGRLYEQGLNGYGRTVVSGVNITRKRYLYYEDDDPTAYRTLLWYEYTDPKNNGWRPGFTTDDHTPTVYDEAGRVSERISFDISKDNTHAVPGDKYVYYYEEDNPDWITREHYKMNNGNWDCADVTNRRLLPSGVTKDEDGDPASRWKRVNTCGGVEDESVWEYAYGDDNDSYPLLSPNIYHLPHEADLEYGEYVHEQPASKRVKAVTYTYAKNPRQSYVATYHYTALREGLKEDRMPVSIEPEETSAMFTWGAVEGAETYVLHVYSDAAQAEEICYVVFDKTGRVISINFARHAPKRYAEVEQFTYTLDGLTPGTQYWYTVVGRNAEEKAFESTHGSFRTKGEGENTESIDFIEEKEDVHKFLRDGQIIIRREEAEYTIQGNQIK